MIKNNLSSSVISWISFDAGSTIFYSGVIGYFFPLWLVNNKGSNDSDFALTIAIATGVTLILGPTLGNLMDIYFKKKYVVLSFTLATCLSIAVYGVFVNIYLILLLFAISMICLNIAEIAYNSMLSDISTEQNRGVIGGLGIGIGYAGSFIVVLIGIFINSSFGSYELAFLIISIILALFAVQLVLFTDSIQKPQKTIPATRNEKNSIPQIINPMRYFFDSKFSKIRNFLFVKFWYMSAINAGITFITLFAVETVGIPANKIPGFLFVGIIFSIPGAFIWGVITDTYGPRRCLILVLTCWVLALLIVVLIPVLNLDNNLWWILISYTGFLLGGVWVADRPILIHYSNENDINESFGLYNVAGRGAYLFGSFLWWVFTAFTPYGQIGALSSLVVCLCIALILLVPFKMLSDVD